MGHPASDQLKIRRRPSWAAPDLEGERGTSVAPEVLLKRLEADLEALRGLGSAALELALGFQIGGEGPERHDVPDAPSLGPAPVVLVEVASGLDSLRGLGPLFHPLEDAVLGAEVVCGVDDDLLGHREPRRPAASAYRLPLGALERAIPLDRALDRPGQHALQLGRDDLARELQIDLVLGDLDRPIDELDTAIGRRRGDDVGRVGGAGHH